MAGSLSGLKVVDLSRVLAGPLCAQMLADHGADVIKVESPLGDETRHLGPPFDANGLAAYFSAFNRGKRAITLDLSQEEDRATLEALLRDADVLVENFLPGTLERWNLGYEQVLRERHPRLIYCSISGFGAEGPLGGLPGYDAVLQAMCGVMSINGSPETGPTRVGIPIIDYVTGYNALTGILLALNVRHATGRGQRVEVALFDSALAMLVPHAGNWMASGKTPMPMGSDHPNITPYGKFRAADGELFLGVVNDGQFRRFAAQIGKPDLASDPRFATNPARIQNREALRAEIEGSLAGTKVADLCAALMKNGVPAGPVNTVPQAFAQPHVAARNMLVERDGYRGTGIPVKLSDTPGTPGAPPPQVNQHAAEIRAELEGGKR
jgi:crotonobetainyl-CoA:carnitine CoA-transferase CaiB-like acyl-CoA transferase